MPGIPIPNIRVVTLAAALAAVKKMLEDETKRSHPFVVVNRDVQAEKELAVPDVFFERLPDDFDGDLLFALTDLRELHAAGIQMARHRDQFAAGEPVMIVVPKVHTIEEREQGRQEVLGFEKKARDGLYVTVALVTERLRACADRQEGHTMLTETRRKEIFEKLKPLLPPELSAINLFREGQSRLPAWFPEQTGRQVLSAAYADVAEIAGGRAGRVNLGAIEREQLELVGTAAAIYAKACDMLEAQHEMSALLRELEKGAAFQNATPTQQLEMQMDFARENAAAQHQEMAHDKQGGPALAQLVRAAASMDLNPSIAYATVSSYRTELDCAMLLGRAERGLYVTLERAHIVRLNRWMKRADEADALGTGGDAETGAARRLRDIALRVRSRAGWDEFFVTADANPGPLWVSKSMR